MSGRAFRLLLFSIAIGIIVLLLSLAPFPARATKAFFIPRSEICWENVLVDIPPNGTEYQFVGGPGFNSTFLEHSTLGISLRSQNGFVDFYIEGANVSTKLVAQRVEYWFMEYAEVTYSNTGWVTVEYHQNTSGLNLTYTVPEGMWQYRLRLENRDAQATRTVESSVVENWTETDPREVSTFSNLLPFEFTYLGIAFLAPALGMVTLGTVAGKFRMTDFRRSMQGVYDHVRHSVDSRERVHEIIVLTIMVIPLLILSTFAHTRIGVGEISMNGETTKTLYTYYGFPFEHLGSVTPVTVLDYQIFDTTFMQKINLGHSQGMYSGITLVFTNDPVSGRVLMLWDGLLLNVLFYSALSFFLLTALDWAKERFAGVSIKYLLKRGNQIRRTQ